MVKQRDYEILEDQVIVIYHKMFPLYVVKGKKNFLIDSGVTARAEEFCKNLNRVLGETGGTEKDGIQTLMLTHSHWDHTGASSYLQEKYGFDVIASERAVELLQKPKVIGFIDRLNQDYKKMIGDESNNAFTGLERLNTVKEGDTVHVDDYGHFEVYETPGHTKCSVSYLLQPGKILFPGDATGVLETDGSIKPLFLSSFTDYENSLEKLLGLDAEILAFPHNLIIRGKKNVKKHIQASLDRTRSIRDIIIDQLDKEDNIDKIAHRLYLREFPKPTLLGPREALMINLEAMIKSVRKECL